MSAANRSPYEQNTEDNAHVWFWAHVDKAGAGGCWLWQGGVARKGDASTYGRTRYRSRNIDAHRASYILAHGSIPAGMTIDHLCRVRLCVNPKHLEAVTNRENVIRGEAPSVIVHRSGACARGHSKLACGRQLDNGKWVCLACNADAQRVRKYRKEVERLRGEVQSLTLDAVRTESLCHGYTSDLAEAQGEVERLRAELAASEARQAWTASHDEWRAELERLRAENAELREALWALDEYGHLACVVDPECGCCTKCDARAALAKGGDK